MVFCLVREFFHFKQVTKLEELLKSYDLSDYYAAKTKKVVVKPKNNNPIMEEEEPNKIAFDDPNFDIKKIKEINVDGNPIPFNAI